MLACGVFFASPDNREKAWRPVANAENVHAENELPRFLLLSHLLGKYAETKPITPWELQMEASRMVLCTPPILDIGDLEILTVWCMANCQMTGATTTTALLSLTLPSVGAVDVKFSKLHQDRLRGTLVQQMQQAGPLQPSHVI